MMGTRPVRSIMATVSLRHQKFYENASRGQGPVRGHPDGSSCLVGPSGCGKTTALGWWPGWETSPAACCASAEGRPTTRPCRVMARRPALSALHGLWQLDSWEPSLTDARPRRRRRLRGSGGASRDEGGHEDVVSSAVVEVLGVVALLKIRPAARRTGRPCHGLDWSCVT